MPEPVADKVQHYTRWLISYWILLVAWVTGALLFMYHVKAGILNNWLSDTSD